MSAAVMSSPMFECGEFLLRTSTAFKAKEFPSYTPSHGGGSSSTGAIYNASSASSATAGGHAPLRRSYTSLVTSLIEQHRKLDRSVSEPTSRYKTELCRPFDENGVCKYGDKCQFAHGLGELRNLARHPKYKTELCRTFHTSGFCPYGPRCHFIHNVEEARIHNRKVSAQTGLVEPNILDLSPILSSPPEAPNNSVVPPPMLARTNPQQVPLMRTTSQGIPKPLNLSPTFSLGSNGDSISPSSSLSQSPTNSMASFFSEDSLLSQNPPPPIPGAFGFAQDFGGLLRHTPSPQEAPRTPSPLSPNGESRLPVFNRISSTIADFENLQI